MAPDASSAAFANDFNRFTSRRGVPHMLISDHGSNFRGNEKELKSLAESIYNEKPLCMMDADNVDLVPITPNSFIYGRELRHFTHEISEKDLNDPDFRTNNK